MKRYCIVFIMLFACAAAKAETVQVKDSIQIAKIWDAGAHNAFTDLIRFKNRFYCSFREGAGHSGGNGKNGKVRILTSKNGKKWESIALLETEGVDLRDPKLSVTPDNRIMVIMAGVTFDKTNFLEQLYPMVSFSGNSGKTFSLPEKSIVDPAISPSRDWIWRVAWHKGIGYGINYQLKENARDRSSLKRDAWLVYLMRTTDGKHYEKVSQLDIPDLPNEATVRFDDNDNAYVLVRKEAGDKMGVLAKSGFPYSNWEYHDVDFRLGGPNFIFFGNNKLIVGTRLYEAVTSTGILLTDLNGRVLKTIKLKGSGDTSYPGMLVYKKKLWVSYYSSHEAKTSIYMAQIPMSELETL